MSDPVSPQPLQAADFSRRAVESIADPVARLRVIMKRLLDPGGCPWDREQTQQTLKQYLIEEAHEVCEAIDNGSDPEIVEELGDVALQVIFHAELAERAGRFRLEDVYEAICRKLIDRHPHVFGEATAETSDAVLVNWERIKKEEKRRKAEARAKAASGIDGKADGADGAPERPVSALDGVPLSMPALQRAQRLQQKAAKVGFDWDKIGDVAAKVREEVEEFIAEVEGRKGDPPTESMEEELGDLLFSLVNLSRFMKIQPEEALRGACSKFTRRFGAVEAEADRLGRELSAMTLAEMDAIWDRVKANEKAK